MMSLYLTALIAALTALFGGIAGYELTASYKDAVCSERAAEVEAAHSRVVVDQAVRIADHEQTIGALRTEVEKGHAEAQVKVARTLEENRRLVRLAGGLRDPGKAGGCPVPAPAKSAGRGDPPADGGRLSGEAEEFLLAFAADADRVVEQYRACRAWALSLEKVQ